MKKCEYCNIDHDGKFGKGRFCSIGCAKGFSTKVKRKFINEIVSLKMRNGVPKNINSVCVICKSSFITEGRKKTCSDECNVLFRSGRLIGKKYKTGDERKKGSGGLRDGGGRSKMLLYTNNVGAEMKLNSEEIEIAKIMDNLKLNWERNKKGFGYADINGKFKKFYPDFYISDYDTYLEYKGWVTTEMDHKMKDSLKRNEFKLIIIYGNNKRYCNRGLCISKIQENNFLLMMELIK